MVAPEYSGWCTEQAAWRDGVALMELSYHMWDTFVSGPDATRMLREVRADNFEKFAVNQAKQLVTVNEEGYLVGDAILLRRGEQDYVITGRPPLRTGSPTTRSMATTASSSAATPTARAIPTMSRRSSGTRSRAPSRSS